MNDICVIFNPNAKRGRLRCISKALADSFQRIHKLAWLETSSPGEATELARKAGEDRYRCVVAMGGDGTVHEVVNGLMSVAQLHRPALGVIPVGTGNDFAYATGAVSDPQHALRAVLKGKPAPIDVGRIYDDNGRRAFFINSAGMLLDAAINRESQSLRRPPGFLLYFAATIRSLIHYFEPVQMRLTTDGRAVEQSLVLMAVGNGKREGGVFMITPDAKINDGLLDYVTVRSMSRWRMFGILPCVMRGTHGRYKPVTAGQFRTMQVEADRPIPIHLDGELWARREDQVRRIQIEVLPGAIQLIG